jgi:tRNA-specific 2-thiouridylase
MNRKERIVVAMSGGVDSAVAAARLHDAGHEVIGVTLHLWDYPDDPDAAGGHARCCAPEDQYDARRMADAVGFPHYTFDRRSLFAEKVVAPFVQAYLVGETPSPCTACNRGVKLGELFAIADKLGARYVATGHYARVGVETTPEGQTIPYLMTGIDESKDQSYFLYATPPEQIARFVFPLGESLKVDVRAEAVARGLPGATKGESQELCFVGGGHHAYTRFVEERAEGRIRPGAIVDDTGRVVGHHQGIHRFTVGQRKGLGVALGAPAFVERIDADAGTVHLSTQQDRVASSAADVDDLVLASGVTLPRRALVRVRYRHEGAPAELVPMGPGRARMHFDGPVRAITKGQVADFYEGDRVLGGGRIVGPAEPLFQETRATQTEETRPAPFGG